MSHLVVFAACAAAILASIGTADAQQVEQNQVGTLECRGGPETGFTLGPVTNLTCVLHADSMPDSRYIVAIENLGIDIGDTDVALTWKVIAPVPWLVDGALAGAYDRADGPDANALIGGSSGPITLQPSNEPSEADLNIESLLVRPE